MAYDWYDDIDRLGWDFEDKVQQATASHGHSLGMAPSAGDEVRTILRSIAAVPPSQLIDEAATTSRTEVDAAIEALAIAAVEAAMLRSSRHVTRDDVRTATTKAGVYPLVRE